MGELTLQELHSKRKEWYKDKPLLDHLVSKYSEVKADPLNNSITSLINILQAIQVHTKEELLDLDVTELYKQRGMGRVKINLLYSLIGEEEPFYIKEVIVVKKEKKLILKDKYK